uniref:G-protein coupled receptors family 1 profile domain-containing protein n=1 Tax=Strix occidentalis caurina TaxID=311401 RepID=A0A8D0FA11_STROC
LDHLTHDLAETPQRAALFGDETGYITDVAIDTVTLLICLCGLVGNGAVLWLLGFCIRRNPITVYVLNLAVADSTFLLFMVASALLYMINNISCSTTVSLTYLRSLFLLSLFSYNMGLYLLTTISIERCVSILCPLWYRCHRPQHLSAGMCALLWALSITVIAAVTSLCLLQEHEHCQIALISMYGLNFLIFAPPMVISNVILFIKVLCGSQRRQPKRLYIVIFLTVLFFLIFGVALSIWNFLQQFAVADFSLLLLFFIIVEFLCHFFELSSLGLLTTISVERCISVFFPIWYRCHRPKHLSGIVSGMSWALTGFFVFSMSLSFSFAEGYETVFAGIAIAVSTILSSTMLISNLLLFIKLQCGSQRRQPGKLYVVVLLSVIFFFAFGIPFSVEVFLNLPSSHELLPEKTTFLLALLNCSINPVIYFLVGSWRQCRFQGSMKVALRRVFEEKVVSKKETHVPEDTVVGTSL